jgi:hypothetical protein
MLVAIGSVIALVIVVLITPFTEVYAQDTTELINYDNGTRVLIIRERTESFPSMEQVLLIAGTIGAAIATAILTPLINERYKIREEYLVPYRKWCISFSGILHEFSELCCAVQSRKKVTDTDLIVHTWGMHQALEEGYRWLNVVKRDDATIGNLLDDMMDEVDEMWHELQDENPELKAKQSTPDDIYLILNDLTINNPHMLNWIANDIKDKLDHKTTKRERVFAENNFNKISHLLEQKIPMFLKRPGFLKKKAQNTNECH